MEQVRNKSLDKTWEETHNRTSACDDLEWDVTLHQFLAKQHHTFGFNLDAIGAKLGTIGPWDGNGGFR